MLLIFYWACFQFKNSRESIIETGNSYHREAKQPIVVEGKFPPSMVHISLSIDPLTLIWVSMERLCPPAELEYK